MSPSISFEKVDLDTSEAGRRRPTQGSGATPGNAGKQDDRQCTSSDKTLVKTRRHRPRLERQGRYHGRVIFKAVRERAPYPEHELVEQRNWTEIPPRQVRLDQLTTTRATLDLRNLLDDDSTFYGDLFAHVVSWHGELFLETGLHRALRAALQGRTTIHARVLEVDDGGRPTAPPPPPPPGA